MSVTAPDSVLLPLTLLITPWLTATPAAEMTSAEVMPPEICSCAPLATVVEPAVVPSAVLLAARSAPELTVVEPVYEFAPDSVSVPEPVFVIAPVPLTIPLNDVLELSPPLVSVAEPSVMLPVPAIEPTVSATLFKSNVPVTVTAEAFGSEPVPLSAMVPAEIVVAPVYAGEPEMVSVPAPAFVRPPLPVIVPLKIVLVPSPPAVRVADPSDTLPAPASEPTVSALLLASNVAPVSTSRADVLAMRSAAPSCRVPPDTRVVPV